MEQNIRKEGERKTSKIVTEKDNNKNRPRPIRGTHAGCMERALKDNMLSQNRHAYKSFISFWHVVASYFETWPLCDSVSPGNIETLY